MKICLDLRLPAVKQHIDTLYSELNGKLSKENIGFAWNYWYRVNKRNIDKIPTAENIVDSYTELEALTAQDEFNNTSVTDKQAIIDLLQSLYFSFMEKASGKKILTREDIAKNQTKVFNNMPIFLDANKLFFISDSFEDYKQYFVSQRLRKFQVPEEDLEAEETKEKDTISSQSSVYNDPFARVSDEALYLVASLKSNETVFGLPKPVNYNEVVNTLQNTLAGNLNIIDHAETLKSIKDKYYWVSQVMDKLGIFEDGYGPEEIYGGVRTSFNEAFSKTQMDIITSSVGKKQAYSALESQTRESLKNRYRTNFNNGEYSHTVNGKRIFNWPKYHALGLTKKPEDLIKFLEIFGIELNPNVELTDVDLYDIEQMKHFVDIYKYDEKSLTPLQWLDSEIIDVSSRLNNIIELQIPFENETKKLSVNNAEGKKLYAVSNNNFFSRIFNKLKLGKQKAIGNYQELIAQGKIKLAILSGSQFGSEGKVFNKLDESTILNTFITNMFSNTPIISIPRTADKTMERAIKITDIKAKDLNKVMAWTTINDDILKQFYKAFEQDVAQKFHPDWIYAGKGAKAIDFWTEAFGLEAGAKFSEFKEAILKHISEQNQETYDYWLQEGVIYLKETDKGTFMNFSFTDNILDKMNIDWKSSNEIKEAGVRKIIDNYNFNNLYFGVLNTQLTQGSMMGVKIDNFYKRTSGPAAESRQNRVDYLIVDKINSEMKELGLPFVGDKFKVFIHSDTLSSNNDKFILDISDEYGEDKINVDDAQGIMHLAVYRNMHKTNNQWLPRQEEAFQKIMRGEKLDKESYDVIFPAKPVGDSLITVVKDGETYKIPIYIKTAVYPISPADVKGTMNELKYNLMMEKGIGLFLPESGIKMAVPRHLQPLFKDGKIQFDERNTFDFPMEDFGIQLDINAKTTHDQLFGTQIRKQLMSNLFEHGSSDPKYVKWVEDNIDTIQKLNDIETKKLYAKAGVQEVNNNGIITYTITDYTKLAKMVKDELMSREMPTNVLDSISSIINKEGNLLGTIDALPARQKIMNLLNSIVTNKLIRQYINGTASVQISQQGWELQKIDNPTDENIIAIDSAIDFVSNDAKIAYYHNNGVAFFTSKDGRTAEAGCLLSSKYKSFVKKDEEGNYIIDDERVLVSIGYRIPTQGHNSALHLKVAGFLPAHLGQMIVLPKEITVQSGGDFDVDKVNIFLPNTITLNGVTTFISEDMNPEEIYEQLKAEAENKTIFDKMLSKMFATTNEEGELEDFDLGEEEKPEDISNKDKFIDVFITKQLQNKLISQAVAILEDPKIATQMITPNSPGTLKDKAAKIAEAKVKAGIPLKDLKVTLKNMFNGVTLAKITNQMFASKALVGVFASQATHHVLAQQVGLHFDTGRPFFFSHNKVIVDGEPKSSLSNIKTVTGELISDKLGNNKLTAAVDAAKKNYLAELGITIDTGDVAALFDRLGGNEDYLFAWLELPIIQDYLKVSKFNSSLVAKATKQTMKSEKLIKKVMKKHGLITDNGEFELGYSSQYLTEMDNDYKTGAQLLEAREARGEYTVDELNDVIYNKKSNPKLLLDLLDDFLYFQEASLILRQSISTSKFDTAGPGKNLLESFILQLKYNKFVEKMALGRGYTLKTISTEKQTSDVSNNLHKYELFPGVFANKGQRDALDKLRSFLNSNEKEIILIGRGGTGKTTIIKKILEDLPKSARVGGITPSHKAKKVLGKSIGKDIVKTVHSALAIKLDENTGKFVPDDYARSQGKIPIKHLDIIIVDESSMVSDKLVDEIMLLKKPTAKVIFMGDNAQLPPIGQETDSKVFDLTNKIELLEKMRQAETSPIINIGEIIANNIESKNPTLQVINDTREGKYDTESNSFVDFINNEETLLNNIVEDVKNANDNPNFVKVVTFNNEKHDSPYSVKNLNDKIREKLWEEKAKNQFNVGEMVTAYDNYGKEGDEEMQVYNSDDLVVISVEEAKNVKGSVEAYSKAKGNRTFNYNYDIIYLGLKDDEGNEIVGSTVPVIADSSKEQYEKDLAELWKTDTQLGVKLKQEFANIQYGYTITSHKAQGSTYTNTYVLENNILGPSNGGTVLSKNKSLYVAVSRPTNKLVIFNPNKNESISDKTKKEFVKKEKEQYIPEQEDVVKYYPAPYTNLIHKTLLSVFYKKSFNFVMGLYKNMTVMTMDNNYDIQSVVKSLISKDEYKFVNKDANTTEAELIYGAVVNHIIQNQINLDKKLFFGNNTLADKIIKIQEDASHPLHDNEIIQDYFNIELSADNLTPNLLTPLNKNLPIEDSNQYTAAFEQIKEEDIDLYNDFLNVSLFQTGVLQSPSSFYNILPEKDTFAKTNPLLSNSSSINYDAKQVAKSVIANIGSKMTNLKTVYLSNSEFKPNSAGIVDVKEVVYNKFEGYQFAKVMVNEKEHFVMELEPGKFEVIKPQNHKVLFYNHTSDNLELPVIEDEFQDATEAEENPFVEEATEQPINKEIKPDKLQEPKGEKIAEGVYINQDGLSKNEQLELFNYLKPFIEEQAAKTNMGTNAPKMLGLGLNWDYVKNRPNAKQLKIVDPIVSQQHKYGYYDLSINGKKLGEITPRFRELIEKATGINIKDYDGAIINLYDDLGFISNHNDVDESKSALKYPVTAVNIGGSGNFHIGSKTINLKAGAGYSFGYKGKARTEYHRTFPSKQDGFLPEITTKIDGKTYKAGSYRISITMRRVMPLEQSMPTEPNLINQPTEIKPKIDSFKPTTMWDNLKKQNLFTVKPIQSADKKAIIKASVATQYIGFGEGIAGSSTENYRQQVLEQEKSNIDFQVENSGSTTREMYLNRTAKNASADATLDFGLNQEGESWTKGAVIKNNKKYIGINTNNLTVTDGIVNKIVEQLNNVKAKSLNIAGMGIYNMKSVTQEQVDNYVYQLLNNVINSSNLKTKIESIRTGGQTGFDEAGAKAGQRLGIKTLILAPKGFTFRNKDGKDISNEQQFINRFKTKLANSGNYSSNDVIFVSIGGKRGDVNIRKEQQDKTIREALKAIEAGATLITDNKAYVESSDYNEGEKRLYENLKVKGYNYSEQTVDGQILGIWKKSIQSKTMWDSLEDLKTIVLNNKNKQVVVKYDKYNTPFNAIITGEIEEVVSPTKLTYDDGRIEYKNDGIYGIQIKTNTGKILTAQLQEITGLNFNNSIVIESKPEWKAPDKITEFIPKKRKLFDSTNKELKKGSVVEYNGEKYLYWNVNESGKAQLIKTDGTKFSGTPTIDKLKVLGNYKTTKYNNVDYIVTDNNNVYSGATGNLVYTGKDNSSKTQKEKIITQAYELTPFSLWNNYKDRILAKTPNETIKLIEQYIKEFGIEYVESYLEHCY